MPDASSISGLKIALRTRICAQCDPVNLDAGAAAASPRDCEEECLLFIQTPRLARLAEQSPGEPVSGYGEIVRHLLRIPCQAEHHRRAVQNFGVEALATIEQFVTRPGRPD